jgi:hypothetical protein
MYDGSTDTKENKKDMLKEKFENFPHIPGETITQQYYRYVEIINSLEEVDVIPDNRDQLRKLMSALPNDWTYSCIAIMRTENLSCVTLSELCDMNLSWNSSGSSLVTRKRFLMQN